MDGEPVVALESVSGDFDVVRSEEKVGHRIQSSRRSKLNRLVLGESDLFGERVESLLSDDGRRFGLEVLSPLVVDRRLVNLALL